MNTEYTQEEEFLFENIKNGNIKEVQNTLLQNPDLKNSKTKKQLGLVALAFAANQREIFDYLVDNLENNEIFHGQDPLSLAIEYKDVHYATKIINSGKVKFDYDSPYLIEAYQSGAIPEIINALKNIGLDLSYPTFHKDGLSTFNRLFQNGKDQEILLNLSDEEKDKLITKDTFYSLALNKYLNRDVIKTVFAKHNLLTEEEKDGLFNSAYLSKNYTLMSETLDLPGFYPSKKDVLKILATVINSPSEPIAITTKEPFHKQKNEQLKDLSKLQDFVMEYCTDFDGYKDFTGVNILSDCLNNNKLNLFKHFIEKGADVNEPSNKDLDTPLITAIRNRNFNAMHTLLDNGASTTIGNVNGHTPLHIAVSNGSITALDILLTKGSGYLNSTDLNGHTPLNIAILANDRSMISQLLWKGADIVKGKVEAGIQNGIYMIEGNNVERKVELESKEEKMLNNFISLASVGFNLNQYNEEGETFPHYFIRTNNVNNLNAFLSLNINLNMKNYKGDTVLMTAYKSIDEIFNNVLNYDPANVKYDEKNNDGKDIYDLLIESKKIQRVNQTLEKQLKYKDVSKFVVPILNKVIPILTFAGDISTPIIKEKLEKYVKNGLLTLKDKQGNSLLFPAIMSGKVENFETILELKPQQIFVPHSSGGKTPIELIEMIKEKKPEDYLKFKSILDKHFPNDLIEAMKDSQKKNTIEDNANNLENKPNISSKMRP